MAAGRMVRMRDDTTTRFRAGDHAAVAELYDAYAGAVTTVARSMLWSEDLVADAVQQTFVKAWKNRRRYDAGRPFAPWLYAIARRTALDLVRFEKRRAGPPLDHHEPSSDGVSFEQVWERFEVRAAIDALPEDERAVVRLQHLEGRTHADIAARLGVPLGTVKSRSHRAHGRLSELLGHVVGEPEPLDGRMEEGR